MPIQLVNGFVLLPQRADWSEGISMTLQWLTEIALAKRGHEDRASMRPAPQAQMVWQIVTTSPMDGATLEDAVRAALRSGQACAPCHPRPSYVVSVAGDGLTLTLETTQWPWAVGDYLFTVDATGGRYVCQVQAVDGAQLTLNAAIPAVDVVWPLVFGRLEAQESEQEGPDTLALTCRLYIPAWRPPTASAALVMFAGAPVVPAAVAADWDDTVNRSFAYDQDVQQIGFGLETLEIEQSYVQHGVELTARLGEESAVSDLESFLCTLGGRRGNFWLPGLERAMLICDPVVGPEFDFAVLRYQPSPDGGNTLISQTAVLGPPIAGDACFFRAQVIPVGAEQSEVYTYGPGFTLSNAQPYLVFGGHSGDNLGQAEAVLINFGRLAADNPALATVQIRLRAHWRTANGNGHVNLQCTTYAGGTVQGGTFPSGSYAGYTTGITPNDFTSQGGVVVETINMPVVVGGSGYIAGDPDGQDCGTLVYTPATRQLAFVTP